MLGETYALYDRTLDLLILTHPQKDHLAGLLEVVKRFRVKQFVTVPVGGSIEEYHTLKKVLTQKNIPIHYLSFGEKIQAGEVRLTTLWPHPEWLLTQFPKDAQLAHLLTSSGSAQLSENTSELDLNTFSFYLHLEFKSFDALFTGDGDQSAQGLLADYHINLPEQIELLKVPHHGSQTGMSQDFLKTVAPDLAVISVGAKNSYGHPNTQILSQLSEYGQVLRTDRDKTIEVISDGNSWKVLH